jgi:hypothetical protein
VPNSHLDPFIERTNFLARWCEKEGLEPSPMVQVALRANEQSFL